MPDLDLRQAASVLRGGRARPIDGSEASPAYAAQVLRTGRTFSQVADDALARAREGNAGPETTGEFVGREMLPLAKGKIEERYREARSRFEKAQASDNDLGLIARYEAVQKTEQDEGTLAGVGRAVANVPKILLEATAGGRAVAGGKALLGLGRGATAAAEAAPLLSRAGAASAVRAAPGTLATGAAATPFIPDLYYQDAQQRATKNGGNWYDPQNITPAAGYAVLQAAVLGHAQRVAGAAAPTVAGRAAVGGTVGFGEQQAGDVVASLVDDFLIANDAYKVGQKYGAVAKALRGEQGATKELAAQLVTFSLFSALQGGKTKPGEKPDLQSDTLPKLADAAQEATAAAKKTGLSEQGAARQLAFVTRAAGEGRMPDSLPKWMGPFEKALRTERSRIQPADPLAGMSDADVISAAKQFVGFKGTSRKKAMEALAASPDTIKFLQLAVPGDALQPRRRTISPEAPEGQPAGEVAAEAKPEASVPQESAPQAGIRLGAGSKQRVSSGFERIEVQQHGIQDAAGNRLGFVNVIPEGDNLKINWIGMEGAGGGEAAGRMGAGNVRDLFRQLAEAYPDAKTVTGLRAGGVHKGLQRGVSLNKYRAAPQAPEPAKPPEPASQVPPPKVTAFDTQSKPALAGRPADIAIAGERQRVPARYEVVELADLKPSHRAGNGRFLPTPDYPANLQPRNYRDPGEQGKVLKGAANLVPARLLSDIDTATDGPPAVSPEGFVLNGNGRAMMIQRAAATGKLGGYKTELARRAESFGLDPATIQGMKEPVLIRRVDLPAASPEAARFARSGNVGFTQSQSPVRAAASLAGLIDADVLGALKLEGDTTFSDAVTDPSKGKSFRNRLRAELPPTEVARYFQADGQLTDAGKEFVRNMLLTKVVPADLVERLGDESKAAKRAVEGAIPQLLKLQRDMPGADPTPQLVEALEFIAKNPQARSANDVDNLLSQMDLFGGRADEITPGGRMLLDFVLAGRDRPRVFRERLVQLATTIDQTINGLFKEPNPDIPAIAAKALGVLTRSGAKFGVVEEVRDAIEAGRQEGVPDAQIRQSLAEVKDQAAPNEDAAPTGRQRTAEEEAELQRLIADQQADEAADTVGPEQVKPADELPFAMEQAINVAPLTKQQREALLAVMKGHSLRDLAPKMGLSHEMVRKHANAAVEKMRADDPGLWAGSAAEVRAEFERREALSFGEVMRAEGEPGFRRGKPGVGEKMAREARAEAGIDPRLPAPPVRQPQVGGIPGIPGTMPGFAQETTGPVRDFAMARAKVTDERAARGQEAIAAAERFGNAEAWAEARNVRREDPQSVDRLLTKIEQGYVPSADGPEVAMLLLERVALANAHAAAANELIKAQTMTWDGQRMVPNADPAEVARLRTREEEARQQRDRLDELTARVGTRLGRGLQFFRQIANEDYSLGAMLRDAEVAKGKPLTDPEKAKIGQLSEKIAAADATLADEGSAKPKGEKDDLADRRIAAKKLREEFAETLAFFRRSNKPPAQRAASNALEAVNVFRVLQTAFDLSALLRQGGFMVAAHPVRSAKAVPDMLRAAASERAFDRQMDEINQRAYAPLYKGAGLFLADVTGPFNAMEEAFAGRWVKRIPGIKASERAYAGILNRFRADAFDALVGTLARDGKPTMAEAKAVAHFVNVATGRGSLGKAEPAAGVLAQGLFSPRYLMSRLQLASGQPLWGGTWRTRKLAAQEYGRALMGLGAFYAVVSLLNEDERITFDPRSADFGKVRFGNTRLDPLAGLSQITVFGSRALSGETVDPEGRARDLRGNVFGLRPKLPKAGSDTGDVILRFLRSKLAPVPGAAADLMTGKDAVGRPTTPLSVGQNLVLPFGPKDVYEVMVNEGMPRSAALALLAILGMGVQVHKPKATAQAG